MIKLAALFVGILVLSACATSGDRPIPTSLEPAGQLNQTARQPAASTFEDLFDFDVADGAAPQAGLVALSGSLYGTTQLGGDSNCANGYSTPGCGTVFVVSPSGKEKVIYDFQGAPDGAISFSPLIDVNGTLYGTTILGGTNCPGFNVPGCGTVFKITPSGKETVLHSFGAGNDGATPSEGSSLIFVKGALYGVTTYGGTSSDGTIFEVTLSGKERVLFNFKGGAPGAYPKNLIFVDGAFYGVASNSTGPYSKKYGMIFRVTMSGKEAVLYDFKGAPDGTDGYGEMVARGDTIYGATLGGGIDRCSPFGGCGTVFSITTKGKEKILYRFDPQKGDGVEPYGGLIAVNGSLYGTTCCDGPQGSGGTVFKLTTSGEETIIHGFQWGGKQGAAPYGTPTFLGNSLYGTTGYGGDVTKKHPYGYGTVFSIAP
jgi:uncharacterized repeat protein (TIGR03803 family)